MFSHLEYIAPKGWKPKNPDEDYLITELDIELADGVPEDKFEQLLQAVQLKVLQVHGLKLMKESIQVQSLLKSLGLLLMIWTLKQRHLRLHTGKKYLNLAIWQVYLLELQGILIV